MSSSKCQVNDEDDCGKVGNAEGGMMLANSKGDAMTVDDDDDDGSGKGSKGEGQRSYGVRLRGRQ